MANTTSLIGLAILGASLAACSPPAEGLLPAAPARTTVKMDFFAKPLPEIALPNDIATRYDASSPTGRRINASMVAPTAFERRTRQLLDQLDGWGVMQPIIVPFTGPIDVQSVRKRHDDADYDLSDDAIYLVNIDRASPRFGQAQHLDVGNGNYPVVLEKRGLYYKNGVLDPGEDVNGNGKLDPGEDLDGDGKLDPPEDTDADGILDQPNYLPGLQPADDDLAGRTDALMYFYERSTSSLIARPLVPLDDRTRYAVVVTRRILDTAGDPVGSPYPYINHTAQNEALEPLLEVLPEGLGGGDIAFAFSFTTQTIKADWQAVRDGLYGQGTQAHLAEEFPAEIASLEPMRDSVIFPDMNMPHLMYGEVWRPALAEISAQLLGEGEGELLNVILEGTGYVDYYVVGTYESPQLFPREGADGQLLGLNDQVWPQDLSQRAATARTETIYFSLSVPRKEVSVRGEGKPAPLVILGHGYTGNRFDVMQLSSYFARHGIAVIGIDGPSHGIGISTGEKTLATALMAGHGIGNAGTALLNDRAFDQNFDGAKDSGADFWTSYLFHTRDMVRQYALDTMQLARIVRSFDGTLRWKHDVNGDGTPELAGDFDADGAVDIGLDSPLFAFGGSLGGIMSMILGAVEPAIEAIAAVSGGGGYGDMGPRSTQGGVYQAFILRAMGPLVVGTLDTDSDELLIETIVTDLNSDATFTLATVPNVKAWDTMVVDNLSNGVRRCGFINAQGTVRVSMEADRGDGVEITLYRGPQVLPSKDCVLRAGVEPYATIKSFEETLFYQGDSYEAGAPLVTLMQGLGMRRGHPDFRRLGGLGHLVLDPADPAVLARHLLRDPLSYRGGAETTGAHSLIITTMGDTSVPVSGGIVVGRASGLINYLEVDDRYQVPPNQVLIDTFTTEGVHNLKRFTNSAGEGVHLDVENFSGGDDMYGKEVPRFNPAMRFGFDTTDPLGGQSAAIFPYNVPTGQHGFDFPGGMTDKARKACAEACTETEGDNPCGCTTLQTFDIGFFMMNMVGRYFTSGGMKLSADLCQSRNDCPELPDAPAARDPASLD